MVAKKSKKLKKIALKEKAKKLKRVMKKPREVLFKTKPLERTKQAKIKRPPKPVKSLVKTITRPSQLPVLQISKTKLIKPVKLKKPKLEKSLEPSVYKTRIKVIGIGGGGSSIVSEIASEVKKVTFVVANTNSQTLRGVTKGVRHFQFGKSITQGLGTGMNPELGEQAAESDKEKIKELLKETDFCILISCLGGGSGSGAAPVFAKILKNRGIHTLGIFTLPFEFERGKRTQIAKDSLEKLRQNLNALVIIPNQKIFQIINKNTPLKEAFSTVNKFIAESLEGLITLIYSPGLIQVDFADLKTILSGRGKLAYLNTAKAKNLDQIKELTEKILFNPLFPYSVKGAKEVLFNIDGGLNLNMSQVEEIGKTISSLINPRARVAFGITRNKKEGIKITLLANGCKWEEWVKKKEKPEKKLKEKPRKKAQKKTEGKPPESLMVQQPEITQIPTEEPEEAKITVRRSALEIRQAIKEEEKKILAQERKWEAPAFLRRKPNEIDK